MHTLTRFRELTQKALINGVEYQAEPLEAGFLSESQSFECEPQSLARVLALSEFLGMSRSSVIAELLNCALGDAHEGFLSAFNDIEERNQKNRLLKARVAEFLKQSSVTE